MQNCILQNNIDTLIMQSILQSAYFGYTLFMYKCILQKCLLLMSCFATSLLPPPSTSTILASDTITTRRRSYRDSPSRNLLFSKLSQYQRSTTFNRFVVTFAITPYANSDMNNFVHFWRFSHFNQ